MTAHTILVSRGATARCTICRVALHLPAEQSVRAVVAALEQFEAAHAACGPVTAAVWT